MQTLRPKLVKINKQNLDRNLYYYKDYLEFTEDQIQCMQVSPSFAKNINVRTSYYVAIDSFQKHLLIKDKTHFEL